MSEFKVVARQEDELSELERIRINMAYNFYCEQLKDSNTPAQLLYDYKHQSSLAVEKTNTLLEALGYEDDAND